MADAYFALEASKARRRGEGAFYLAGLAAGASMLEGSRGDAREPNATNGANRLAAAFDWMFLLSSGFSRRAGRRLVPAVFAALIVAAVSSCSTAHLDISRKDNITAEKLWGLRRGATTKAEVESAFGPPLDKVVVKNGEKYFYKDFNLRAVYMEFDKEGVLVEYEESK